MNNEYCRSISQSKASTVLNSSNNLISKTIRIEGTVRQPIFYPNVSKYTGRFVNMQNNNSFDNRYLTSGRIRTAKDSFYNKKKSSNFSTQPKHYSDE